CLHVLTPDEAEPLLALVGLSSIWFIRSIGGLIVFAIGVWTLTDRSFMERLLGTNLYVASAAILIVTGSIVAIISFLGTFGAYKEIKCMLLTYFIILVMIFIVMVTAGILGYVFRLEVDDRMQQEMFQSMRLYGTDTQVTEAWDAVQMHFECCGITVKPAKGYELWQKENTRFKNISGPLVPESCCRSREDDPIRRSCLGRQPRKEDTYYEGCYERMKEFVKSHALLVGGLAIGVSSLILFGIILSCGLYLIIKK
ncbi:Tetraspanin-11, partial [Fragariocoptes setiger]